MTKRDRLVITLNVTLHVALLVIILWQTVVCCALQRPVKPPPLDPCRYLVGERLKACQCATGCRAEGPAFVACMEACRDE